MFQYCRRECFIDRNSCSDFVGTILYLLFEFFEGWIKSIENQQFDQLLFISLFSGFVYMEALDRSVEHRE